jgi:molecular chaperone GrpE
MTDAETVREPAEEAEQRSAAAAEPGAEEAPGTGGSGGGMAREGSVTRVSDNDGGVKEIEGDLDELVDIAAKRDEYLALAQRTQADFENYRKRVARESALAKERGVAKLAKELLPALDNLDRALEAADQDDPLLQGVRLVRSEFSDALARLGIQSYAPVGEAFDPELHEAMASVPQPEDGAESGTVVEVYQPGYRLGEQVIRPARVVVAA